ncbi:protein hsr-9-like [Saccostrea echinata]|uniref:protein hsr-9-like n=1 Tax=Saccostrea echinata TaxID=191078 RepID=UPI002A8394E1|nr:protein hsr-9-like [Saccostrea echinata]
MEKDTTIMSNSQVKEGVKSVQNGESQEEDMKHCGHGSTAQPEKNQINATTKVVPDHSAHPVELNVEKEKDSNFSAAPVVTDMKTETDNSNAPVVSRKSRQKKDASGAGKDAKESTASEVGKADKKKTKSEPRTEAPLTEEQNTNATVTLTAGKKRRQTVVKMEAKPESPDEDVTGSEVPATKKRVGRQAQEKSVPSDSKVQHCNNDENTEAIEVGTKKKGHGKKVVKEESSSQSSEVNPESAVLNGKRQRSRQNKVEDESSPKKPKQGSKGTQNIAESSPKKAKQENIDSQIIAEPNKRRGRSNKAETHNGTGVDDPAEPDKKRGRGNKTETHKGTGVDDPAEPDKKRGRGNKTETHKDTGEDDPAVPDKRRGRGNKTETHKDTQLDDPTELDKKKGRGNKTETHKDTGEDDPAVPDKRRGRGNKAETNKGTGMDDPPEPDKKKGKGNKTETHKGTGVDDTAELNKKKGRGNKTETHKGTELDDPAEPDKKKGKGKKTETHKGTGVDDTAEPNKTETHNGKGLNDPGELDKKRGRGNKTETESDKRRGRGNKTETHKGTGVDDPAPKVQMGKKQKQDAEEHRISKWEKNVAKYKWANSAKDKYVGAHVSISGGLYKAVLEAEELGARAFGLFLRSQRQWASKPLEDKDAQRFKDTCKENGYPPHVIVPHGSYLMNCGSPDDVSLQKSRDLLLEELQRCEKLGLTRFNFHPGSTCGKISVEECLDRIGESINQALAKTRGVTAVIENMCRQGSTVGGSFEELKGIISRVHDKSRIGICLDTCHMFAAGYDISTEKGYQNMMDEFNCVVGQKYLKALHLNDSKAEVGSHLDRHENIGQGRIGKAGFQRIMNDPRLNNIPMILETPCPKDDTYEKEVRILYSMCK